MASAAVRDESPRDAVQSFIDLSRAGRPDEAALLLQPIPTEQPARSARHLKAVLDRFVWFDLEHLSSSPMGNTADGLPADEEDVGRFPLVGGSAPVRLVRVDEGGAGHWRFSAATVASAEQAFDRLGDRWLVDRLPEQLLRPGPRELLWWQWLALPVLLLISLLVGAVLGRGTRAILARLASQTATEWDDELVKRLRGPLVAGWMLLAFYLLLPYLSLYPPADTFVARVLQALAFATFFWALLRLVEVGGQVMFQRFRGRGDVAFQPLISLGVRSTKVVVLAVAIVAVLSELGYPVGSLIAGLGVGGLAMALAAQKTVENVFGAFSIAVDQPFREGDFVKIDDFVGTVESIGLRSTRIRTLDRTLIALPNGKLAEMKVESFTVRDRLKLFATLGLVYETRAEQMRQVIAGLEKLLGEHPKILPGFTVRFVGLGDSSLNVEVFAYVDTNDWNAFTTIRQELLLAFMDVVERAGSGFAFPTRTLHVVDDRAKAAQP